MAGLIGGSAWRGLAAALALLVVLAFAPAVAQAAVVAVTAAPLPANVTVGQTAVPASILITRANTPPDNDIAVNQVCNFGDAGACAGSSGIVLVPSCSQLVGGVCVATGADPGVFRVSPQATGAAGTCLGMVFDTTVLPDAFGTVAFTPQGGAHVVLPTNASTCSISFTYDVLRTPSSDLEPATPGIQTASTTAHRQCLQPCGPASPVGDAQSSTSGTTVGRAGPPSVATSASGDILLGGRLTDQATISGLVNPVAGATVTFRLYPPSAPTCAGPPVFVSVKPATFAGTTATATSDAYTPTATGVYRWIATYDGDANNLPRSGACGEATETRTVATPLPPPFAAKLEVARARVVSSSRRLDVLAPITSRASGTVRVSFQAAGRTERFTAGVDSANSRVRINRRIPSSQARLGTGILTLAYPGDADTQPQEVRLRAASRPASLVADRPTIAGGRLKASGRISSRARGNVRLQVLYEPAGQNTRTLSFSARINAGRYRLDVALPADVLAQIATRRGVVHSYTLFTGYLAARMRGEMASFQVAGER